VAHALDRQAVVTAVYGSVSPSLEPAHSLSYPSTHTSYEPSFARYAYSPGTVNEIMEAHGCATGADGIWVCDGVRASVKLAVTAGNNLREVTQQELQAGARAAGIEVVSDNSPAGVLFGTRLPARDYELIIFSWVFGSDPARQVDFYGCAGSQNFMAYCSQSVTDLLTRAEIEIDPLARASLVNAANAVLAEDALSIPLFRRPAFLTYRTTLHGPANNPSEGGPTWNVEDWWLSP
jgi:peptide/nickel transport system substrate-binding protein